MSLVNDMLRDLEARRAAPSERERLLDMQAVDERRLARRMRWQRGALVGALLVVVALLLALLYWRQSGAPAVPDVEAPLAEVPAVASEPALLALVEVLPQNDGRRFVLQLLLDGSPSYRRTDQQGLVDLLLEGVQLRGEMRSGRIEKDGQSLAWRVEQQGGQVRVQFAGLGERLQLHDRLEASGDRWQLWLEVPLELQREGPPEVAGIELPEAEPATLVDAQWPDWVTRTAPAVDVTSRQAGGEPVAAAQPSVQLAPAVRGPTSVSITSHTPEPLSQARQWLADGEYGRAIAALQALHEKQPGNVQVVRWLARAYLAAGEHARLLEWLPAQLHQHPQDAELRLSLARGQLLVGDSNAALASLKQNPPELAREPSYHALLAALYQQVEDWQGSAATYQALVALRPGQATWQLGLAIALEQLERPAEAGRHYRLALLGQGLDEDSRRFANERAGALGGRS
ncbi:tetratricopeptide repeat protein [Stutzerimonas kirkiae]|uniref:tetratricopeptide repeat protein n=1 Tax=Stutzerimonas kirkiae TaxID=2211392 RepID=UPI0010382F45|nr:tetratricopeptide repeat protein [Stutzerimonas kirkiae]TBV10606.1 hypothetical protein DNK08_06155 [Stutzerimonas kirkiae]